VVVQDGAGKGIIAGLEVSGSNAGNRNSDSSRTAILPFLVCLQTHLRLHARSLKKGVVWRLTNSYFSDLLKIQNIFDSFSTSYPALHRKASRPVLTLKSEKDSITGQWYFSLFGVPRFRWVVGPDGSRGRASVSEKKIAENVANIVGSAVMRRMGALSIRRVLRQGLHPPSVHTAKRAGGQNLPSRLRLTSSHH
jgi:hypothetical protein